MLKMKERATRQGIEAPSGVVLSKETDFPPEAPEGTQACQHLDFSLVRLILDF